MFVTLGKSISIWLYVRIWFENFVGLSWFSQTIGGSGCEYFINCGLVIYYATKHSAIDMAYSMTD